MSITDKNVSNDDKTVFLDAEVLPQVLFVVESAKEHVTFVTPYLQLWGHLRNAIEKAIARGVDISFAIRSNTNEDPRIEDIDWLIGHKVNLYKVPDLHAKIYINERLVLLSSMNITEHSTTNSREFAIMVANKNAAMRFRDYVSDLVKIATPVIQEQTMTGKCIRCGRHIGLNPVKPLCYDCYGSWETYSNEDYPEVYCHSCGILAEVSYAKPFCQTCYRKQL